MTDIVVNIKTPDNGFLDDSQLPTDYTVEQLIDELVDSLELPVVDESSKKISYALFSAAKQQFLTSHETLLSAGVRNGDTLEIRETGYSQNGYASSDSSSQTGNQGQSEHQQTHENQQQHQGQQQTGNSQGQYTGGYTVPPTVEFPSNSEISVVLSVMDLNRHENVSLSSIRPVGDLIKQIIVNYNLPARDHVNQLIKYRLQSKALGRFLDERITLLEAQIPSLDRLTLHREEIAGAFKSIKV